MSWFLVFIIYITSGCTSTNYLNLNNLKRLASESLKLQGIPFAENISQIAFDDPNKWGDLILDKRTVALMTETLTREMRSLRKGNPNDKVDTELILPISRLVYEVKGLSYSISDIRAEWKKKAIKTVLDQLANVVREKCPNYVYLFLYETSNLFKANLTFVESRMGSNNSSCGTVPLGLTANRTIIEISCFDNKTISRLVMSALGFVTPLWRRDRDRHLNIHWNKIADKHKYLLHKWNFDFTKTWVPTGSDHFDYSPAWRDNRLKVDPKVKTTLQSQNIFSKLDERLFASSVCPLGGPFVPFPPQPSPPPAPPAPPCVDQNDKCLFYQEQGQCSEFHVENECPVVCSLCAPVISSSCEDVSRYCSSWSDQCYKTSKHWAYMRSNCKRTCRCPELQDGMNWKSLGETKTVCAENKQSTISNSESECKKFCVSNSLAHCFYSDDDGYCVGAIGCGSVKVQKTSMKHFQSY